MSCHIESCVVSCHIVPCCVTSCCFMCVVSCPVVSKGVSPFRVVSCRVLSRHGVSMWWSPNGVCASFFSKGPWQSHCPSCDQRAQVNNAPEHDPRRRMFGSITTKRQPSGQLGSWCCRSKKVYLHGRSDSAANHRASVEKKKNSRDV